MKSFKNALIETIFDSDEVIEAALTKTQEEAILRIQKEKYEKWEWNYGDSPKANFFNEKRFAGGKVIVEMEIENAIIKNCRFSGDFLSLLDVGNIEEKLKGVRCEPSAIRDVLETFDIWKYFTGITADQLAECFM